mgnify:CR=1 FL=1|jgi:hypothetical protein
MRQRILRAVGILLGALVLWIALLFAAGAVVDSRVPIDLPPLSNVNVVNDRYVSAKGTWVIDGERQAAPLQTTEIICEREFMRCTSATAQVDGRSLHVNLDTYEIAGWEKTRIVFVDTAPTCADYIFTIDFSTKAVSGLRKKKPNGPSVPADCNTLDKELRLSLRSGFKVSLSLKDEALPWFGHLAISPFKLLRTAP